MKKFLLLGLAVVLTVAVGASFLTAGDKSTCSSSKVSDKGACSLANKEACAVGAKDISKLTGMTAEECAKLCPAGSVCSPTMISIQGLTDAKSEEALVAQLSKVEGVTKVVKVSAKEELALVCLDPAKAKEGQLIAAITGNGYKAKVLPMNAKVEDKAAMKACNPAACNPAACNPAACGTKTDKKDKKEGSI